jgi:hypothetical protein
VCPVDQRVSGRILDRLEFEVDVEPAPSQMKAMQQRHIAQLGARGVPEQREIDIRYEVLPRVDSEPKTSCGDNAEFNG